MKHLIYKVQSKQADHSVQFYNVIFYGHLCPPVYFLPGEPMKRLIVGKIGAPEHQSNDIENCLVKFQICLIKLINLPGFNRSFHSIDLGDFLMPLSKTCRTNENNKQNFSRFSLRAIIRLACIQALCPLGRTKYPCHSYRGRLLILSRG